MLSSEIPSFLPQGQNTYANRRKSLPFIPPIVPVLRCGFQVGGRMHVDEESYTCGGSGGPLLFRSGRFEVF